MHSLLLPFSCDRTFGHKKKMAVRDVYCLETGVGMLSIL